MAKVDHRGSPGLAAFEVVPDALRRAYHHRGRPTNPAVVALLDGKTVRSAVRVAWSKERWASLGFTFTYYKEKETGLYVMWLAKIIEGRH